MVRGGQGQEGGLGEREVVNVVDQDGREEEVRRALPMMPVRVLLAEGDDSTRHVISALLRKCGYHGAHLDYPPIHPSIHRPPQLVLICRVGSSNRVPVWWSAGRSGGSCRFYRVRLRTSVSAWWRGR